MKNKLVVFLEKEIEKLQLYLNDCDTEIHLISLPYGIEYTENNDSVYGVRIKYLKKKIDEYHVTIEYLKTLIDKIKNIE